MAFLDLLKTDFEPCAKDRMPLCKIYVSYSGYTSYSLSDTQRREREECRKYFQNLQGAPYCRVSLGEDEFFCRIIRVQEPTFQKKPLSFDYALVNDGRCSLLLEDSNGVQFEAVTIQYTYSDGRSDYYLMPSDALMDRMRKNLYGDVDLSISFLHITPLTNLQAKACMEAAMKRRMAAKVRYENEKRKAAELARAAAEEARRRAQQEEALNNSAEMNDLFRSMGQDWRK